MNTSEHAAFWDRYDRLVRPVIERACRRCSKAQSEGTMDPGDMASWVHTRVWRMLEKSSFPTFHDDPSVDEAIDRLLVHAPTLARWSYLALARKHWRSLGRETPGDLSRVEHLSVTRRADAEIEDRESIRVALDKVRTALPESVREKLAASMPEKGDRRRAALALDATDRAADQLITRVNAGVIKENTVQQMRSRARKHAAEALGASIRLPLVILACASVLWLAPAAKAGEQSGGRKGGHALVGPIDAAIAPSIARGEQSGGRQPGKGHALARDEQSGGRNTP